VKEKEVGVLSLVRDPDAKYQSGWISYRSALVDSPETEIICGGLSEREIDGAALWRQGQLLHFAFDLSPAEMNEAGQALLINSIVYISRFTEDRPIARTPSGWAEGDDAPRSRRWIEGLYADRAPTEKDLDFYLAPSTKAGVAKMDRESYAKWYKENSPYLTCDRTGRLMVDLNAKALGIVFNQREFFPAVLKHLSSASTAEKAKELLKRYAPEGPGDASPDAWQAWWQSNELYLFYTERGGYRWYVDPLAKKRGVPSDKLQGPARARLRKE
jgi:hypothetical protein